MNLQEFFEKLKSEAMAMIEYNPFRENISARLFEMCKPQGFQTSPDLLPSDAILPSGIEVEFD